MWNSGSGYSGQKTTLELLALCFDLFFSGLKCLCQLLFLKCCTRLTCNRNQREVFTRLFFFAISFQRCICWTYLFFLICLKQCSFQGQCIFICYLQRQKWRQTPFHFQANSFPSFFTLRAFTLHCLFIACVWLIEMCTEALKCGFLLNWILKQGSRSPGKWKKK